MHRSFLYTPGHDAERLETAFAHGADAVVFDLEDGVPADRRGDARTLVAEVLRRRSAWVRINPSVRRTPRPTSPRSPDSRLASACRRHDRRTTRAGSSSARVASR